jgi:hypothetical protein
MICLLFTVCAFLVGLVIGFILGLEAVEVRAQKTTHGAESESSSPAERRRKANSPWI